MSTFWWAIISLDLKVFLNLVSTFCPESREASVWGGESLPGTKTWRLEDFNWSTDDVIKWKRDGQECSLHYLNDGNEKDWRQDNDIGTWDKSEIEKTSLHAWGNQAEPFRPATRRESVKKGHFTVRLTVRRKGGGAAPSALTVSKCEILAHLKGLKQRFWTKNACFFHTAKKFAKSWL